MTILALSNLTEFNWIATPSPNCVGNPGWHRTRKPLAYRVSCYTLSPHLNIPRSFKIVIYLILEHIYTSSMNTFPWQSIPFIYRSLRKCILFADMSNSPIHLYHASWKYYGSRTFTRRRRLIPLHQERDGIRCQLHHTLYGVNEHIEQLVSRVTLVRTRWLEFVGRVTLGWKAVH